MSHFARMLNLVAGCQLGDPRFGGCLGKISLCDRMRQKKYGNCEENYDAKDGGHYLRRNCLAFKCLNKQEDAAPDAGGGSYSAEKVVENANG